MSHRPARVLTCLALVAALAGCGTGSGGSADDPAEREPAGQAEEAASSEALDEYVAAERASLETMEWRDTYSEVGVRGIAPSTVEYSYTYLEPIPDTAAAAEYFDSMVDGMQDLCDTQVFPAMARYGIPGPQSATYAYYNADGSLIWSHTFTSS